MQACDHDSTVNEIEAEFPQVCRDCGEVLEMYTQEHCNRTHTDVVTCKNLSCGLWSVTLSVETYNALTEAQLSDYRTATARLKVRFGY